MAQNNWGEVIRTQQQIINDNDNKEKLYNKEINHRYKLELDRMNFSKASAQKEERTLEKIEQDRKFVANQRMNDQESHQRMVLKEKEDYNVRVSMKEQHDRIAHDQYLKDQEKQNERRKMQALIDQERIQEKQKKEFDYNMNNDLRNSYNHMMMLKKLEQQKLKEQDRQFTELESQKMRETEENRNQFFKKIQGGYGQNSQVRDQYDDLECQKKRKERQFEKDFIDRRARIKDEELLEKELHEQHVKANNIKQNNEFLKKQMMEKKMEDRYKKDKECQKDYEINQMAVIF